MNYGVMEIGLLFNGDCALCNNYIHGSSRVQLLMLEPGGFCLVLQKCTISQYRE